MSVNIPLLTDGTPHYTVETTLEGTGYLFEFRWNARDDSWYMQISDTSENVLLAGVRVVADFPLTSRFTKAGLFPGALFAVDTGGEGVPPTLTDLGSRVVLVYFESTELPLE
jgi:hypothetical protein